MSPSTPNGIDPEPVRRFASFTVELERLAAWLGACGVTTVAMESTGVYWIPLFDILEAHGFEVAELHAESAFYTLGYLAERLRKTLIAGSATGPVRFPGSGLGVHVNLFDVLRVHAEKRMPGDPAISPPA